MISKDWDVLLGAVVCYGGCLVYDLARVVKSHLDAINGAIEGVTDKFVKSLHQLLFVKIHYGDTPLYQREFIIYDK